MKNNIIYLFSMALCFFLFLMLPPGSKAAKGLGYSVITGQVQTSDNSFDDKFGKIALFRVGDEPAPDQGKFNRVPDALIEVDSEGIFAVKISPGFYNLGYFNSNEISPLSMLDDDIYFLAFDDNGSLLKVNATSSAEINLGLVHFVPSSRQKTLSGFFTVSGNVVTEKNKGLQDYIVIAKKDFNEIRPLYISKPSNEKGGFQLELPPGSYTLIARSKDMNFGRPEIGELFGIYGQTKPVNNGGSFSSIQSNSHFLSGTDGQIIKDITIFLFPIPDPEKRKKEIKES